MTRTMEQNIDEFIFGRNPILEAIEHSSIQANKIWISKNISDNDLKNTVISYAKENKIPFYIVPEEKLNSLTKNQKHQGLVISISPVKYLSSKELIRNTVETSHRGVSTPKLILVANEIQDTHNLGAIVRTFVAGGGQGIILTGKSSVGINHTVIKTSSGALFQAQFARVTNCVNVLNELKENGFWIVGTDNSPTSESIYKTGYPDHLAILVGNEHEGLGQLIKKNCDFLVKIPISDKIDSLNVSVAFGIVLFEILRQKSIILQTIP